MNRRIDLYNRDKNSGTRTFIKSHVLAGESFSNVAREVSTTSTVAASVSRSQGGIGYGGIAYSYGSHIIRLAKQPGEAEIWPSHENVSSGHYPLSRPLCFYVNPASTNDDLRELMDWLSSPEWQKVVTLAGYYPSPGTKVSELALPTEQQPASDREPVLLTPNNIKRHGFDLSVTIADDSDRLQPGKVVLTIHFSPGRTAIDRSGKSTLEIGAFIIFAILPVLTEWAAWWIAGTHPQSDQHNDGEHVTRRYTD